MQALSRYQYTIKNGDTLSGIIGKLYGIQAKDSGFQKAKAFLLTINPQIKNPNRIYAGHVLRIDEYHPHQALQTRAYQAPVASQGFTGITGTGQCTADTHTTGPLPQWLVDSQRGTHAGQRLPTLKPGAVRPLKTHPHDHDGIWAAAWLEHHAHLLTTPGAVTTGSLANLNSAGNISLIHDIQDLYADYQQGRLTKGQYDYRRAQKIKLLQRNLGPMEKLLFGHKTSAQSLRIARGGGIPATAHLTRHADRVRRVGQLSRAGGLVLVGVGVSAACLQIADTENRQEKNEIFVETLMSTMAGGITGALVGVFLVSNPIGWGTAIVLAVGSTAISYGTGKLFRNAYSVHDKRIDFVDGLGIDHLCN